MQANRLDIQTLSNPLSSQNLFKRDLALTPETDAEDRKRVALRMREVPAKSQEWFELRNYLVASNLGLVLNMARRYYRRSGLEFEDLVQEGSLGLMRAAEMFDPTLGFAFSTYALWHIKQSMFRAIYNKGSFIRVPCGMAVVVRKVARLQAEIQDEKGRRATVEEIADGLHLPIKTVEKIQRVLNLRVQRFEDMVITKDGDEGDIDHLSCLGTQATQEDGVSFLSKGKMGPLRSLLRDPRVLTQREKTVLLMRLGLNGYEEHTLEEVGEHFGFTREMARLIQNKALEKLRTEALTRGIATEIPADINRKATRTKVDVFETIDWSGFGFDETEIVEEVRVARITETFREAASDLERMALDNNTRGNIRMRPVDAALFVISGAFDVEPDQIKNGDSSKTVVWARQVAMFFLRKHFTTSQVAKALNRKTHQSVREACRIVDEVKEAEPDVAADLQQIARALSLYGL